MDEKRREIYKKWAGAALGIGITEFFLSSTLTSVLFFVSHVKKEEQVGSTPYAPVTVLPRAQLGLEASPCQILDAHIDNVPARLMGVSHTREFTQEHYLVLEELVKGCSCAVFEEAPGLIQTTEIFNNAKAYYGTMVEFCRQNDKPVIFLNPFSGTGEIIEELVGLFGAGYASFQSFKIIGENSKRRDFLVNSIKMLAGAYLFACSPIISEAPRAILKQEIQGFKQVESKTDICCVNHSIDQVNVEVTNRLLHVPQMLTQDELRNGSYILVSFGERHTEGVDYYLRHPFLRGLKSAFYLCTYGLVDYDIVMKFVPGQNSWAKIKIPY